MKCQMEYLPHLRFKQCYQLNNVNILQQKTSTSHGAIKTNNINRIAEPILNRRYFFGYYSQILFGQRVKDECSVDRSSKQFFF